jgi:hypothetical protein
MSPVKIIKRGYNSNPCNFLKFLIVIRRGKGFSDVYHQLSHCLNYKNTALKLFSELDLFS